VGIAFEAKIAGVRILGGPITTVDEAAALNFGYQNVSIYSCSWGPRDNGKTMEAPKYIVRKAVVNGINHGRGGKGSIFVFASGNGGRHGDQCNFDGYTNSIYSVTVGAVDHKGLHPSYSEACAANMVVAYSSGSGKHIVSRLLSGLSTAQFFRLPRTDGTSVPIIMVALLLQHPMLSVSSPSHWKQGQSSCFSSGSEVL
jgi:kexin